MDEMSLPAAAARYLGLGLSVIALTGKQPNGKVHRHGLENALVGAPEEQGDFELIREVFEHEDTTGIGVLTGGPYVVVDIDGEEGAVAWARLLGFEVTEHGTTAAGPFDLAPETWIARTGRGMHLWFADQEYKLTAGRRTRKLDTKLDLKGAGGYVAAPPSRHPDGHIYRWLRPPVETGPLEMPDALLARLNAEDAMFEQRLIARSAVKKVRGPRWSPDHRFFAPSWGFEGVFQAVREAAEGNRNATLHWAAMALAEDGAEEEDYDQLAKAATDAGLTNREVRLTILSGRKRVDARG